MMTEPSETSPDDPVGMLRQAIASGRMILVVGDLTDESGRGNGRGVTALRRALIEVATSGTPGDDSSISLEEALQAAKRNDPKAANSALASTTVLNDRTKRAFRQIFSGPWERIYNLAPVDLSQIYEDDSGPGIPSFVDARTEFHKERGKNLVVDFFGLSLMGTGVHFSVPAGEGIGPANLWRKQFAADLVSRPVLMLATSSYPDLWLFMRDRVASHPNTPMSNGFYCFEIKTSSDDMRAGNHLLSSLDMPIVELYRKHLASNITEVSEGHRMLALIRRSQEVAGAHLVSQLLNKDETPSWNFLRGHDPSWADVSNERTVRLNRMSLLYEKMSRDKGKRNVILLTGRSGSGKTALLMRLGYELTVAKEMVVAWIDRSAGDGVSGIVKQVEEMRPDAVLIDNVDIFGSSSANFLNRLNRRGQTLVVASVRTTRTWAVQTSPHIRKVDGDSALSDKDLERLLEKLEEAGLLGQLSGTPQPHRLDKLRKLSERDLLAALIQVVTGEPFEQRIHSEYSDLPSDEQRAYSLICFGASRVYEATQLPEDDLIQMLTPAPPYGDSRAHVESLESKGLIVRDSRGLRVRHRAIADAVIMNLGAARIAEMLDAMLLFYAGHAAGINDPTYPDRRHLIHLLSHSQMVDLNLAPDKVRPIYAKVQKLLDRDFNFWLQRGAYEVERGDLDLADSYLESAKSCPGGDRDFKVITEWGFMRLMKAANNPDNRSLTVKAKKAVDDLVRIARREGTRSPHTFTILIRYGTTWLEKANTLGKGERQALAISIGDIIRLGMKVVQDNRDFARAVPEMKERLDRLASGDEGPFEYPIAN